MSYMPSLRRNHASRMPHIAIVLALVFGAVLAFQGSVAAQDTTFPFQVTKFNCETDPGIIGQAVVPEGCEGVEGVLITAYDSQDTELGNCLTGAGGVCTIDINVPADGIVFAEEDESTGTAGYTPRENPVEVEIVNEFSEAKIVNLKDQPRLPETGSGVEMSSVASTNGHAGQLAAVAGILGLGAALLWRAGIERRS